MEKFLDINSIGHNFAISMYKYFHMDPAGKVQRDQSVTVQRGMEENYCYHVSLLLYFQPPM